MPIGARYNAASPEWTQRRTGPKMCGTIGSIRSRVNIALPALRLPVAAISRSSGRHQPPRSRRAEVLGELLPSLEIETVSIVPGSPAIGREPWGSWTCEPARAPHCWRYDAMAACRRYRLADGCPCCSIVRARNEASGPVAADAHTLPQHIVHPAIHMLDST